MIPAIALAFSLGVFCWVLKRDIALRKDDSLAIWIPTLWLAVIASRPFSMWLGGVGAGDDALEGSPADRMFYLTLIVAAFFVLRRRNFNWAEWMRDNKALLAFYLYFLLSILWADSTVASFKRIFKDFGCIIVLMVILTDKDPRSALKAVFVRCGCVLIPLSLIYIRYFPSLGRRYNSHSGELEAIGVTFQKNSLGALILFTSLFIIFDLIDKRPGVPRLDRTDKWIRWGVLAIGLYLLNMCDSKTSMLCLVIGTTILLSVRLSFFQRHLARIGLFFTIGMAAFFILDATVGVRKHIISAIGRDMTMTGRTEVWRELLALKTNPVIGTGFCSIWSDRDLLERLPKWVSGSAHNGYLEVYLDGGFVGLLFLAILLFNAYAHATKQLHSADNIAVLRFAVVVITLVYNYSESGFGRLSPAWFLFLIAAVHYQPPHAAAEEETVTQLDDGWTLEDPEPHPVTHAVKC